MSRHRSFSCQQITVIHCGIYLWRSQCRPFKKPRAQNETPTKEAGVSLSKLTGANPSRGNGDGPHTKRHEDGGDDARTNRPRHHSSDGDEVRYRRRPVQPLRRRGTPQKRSVESRCLRGQLPMRRGEMTMFCHANAPLFSDFFLMG